MHMSKLLSIKKEILNSNIEKKNAFVLKKSIEKIWNTVRKQFKHNLQSNVKKVITEKGLSAQHFEEHIKVSKIKKRQDKRANSASSY